MLSRVCIFSESAGVCFLDKKWENAPGGRSMDQDTNSVVSLIKFFYQLSREIDDGNVNRVTFQPPQRKARLESHKGIYVLDYIMSGVYFRLSTSIWNCCNA